MSHACYDCAHVGRCFPCRVGGRADPDLIARHRVGIMDAEGAMPEDEEAWWSWECIDAATRDDPECAWQIILACVPLLQTPQQAAVFAAGHLEDLIKAHGDAFLDRIETEWRRSPRFRFVLSGVWVHGMRPDDPIRHRIESLKANRPHINHGDPLPPA